MAFLVIAAVTVPVAVDTFGEVEPLVVGERVSAFDGTLRDSIRARKRRWSGKTRPLTATEYTNVRSALDTSGLVACSGDALGGALTCGVSVKSAAVSATEAGFRRVIEFEMEEA